MSWIQTIEPEDADASLRIAYNVVANARGGIANILKIHSLHPGVMTAHLELYRELMFGPSELSRVERELIATAVSVFNGCHY